MFAPLRVNEAIRPHSRSTSPPPSGGDILARSRIQLREPCLSGRRRDRNAQNILLERAVDFVRTSEYASSLEVIHEMAEVIFYDAD